MIITNILLYMHYIVNREVEKLFTFESLHYFKLGENPVKTIEQNDLGELYKTLENNSRYPRFTPSV